MRTALVIALCLSARVTSATECAAPRGAAPALSLIDAETRLSFIHQHLRAEARRARLWSWSWASAYSLVAVGQLAFAPLREPGDRPDAYLAAGAAAVGVAVLAVAPLKVMGDQRWLDRRLDRAGPRADPCAILADAERLLARDARSEAFGKGLLVHAGSFVFNVGLAVTLAAAFGHHTTAAITGAVGIAVGELQIFTQPEGSVVAWEAYRRGALVPPPPTRQPVVIAPFFQHERAGLSVGLSF